MDELQDMIAKTLDFDAEVSTVEKDDHPLTLKRDENGILWSYDSDGNKVGRIFEHGDDAEEE